MVRGGASRLRTALLAVGLALGACAEGATMPVPPAREEVVSVARPGGATQSGILSVQLGASGPRLLAVLVPGSPGVLRPAQTGPGTVRTEMGGNFLIRSRTLLLAPDIATLAVDCRSDFQRTCPDDYQASEARVRDIEALVAEARRRQPGIEEAWLISTSRGAIASASAVRHAGGSFAGIVHSAGAIDLAQALGLDFRGATPQYLVHHRQDPCRATSYASAARLAHGRGIPLLTARGGNGFTGPPCEARTEHGFWSIEPRVAARLQRLMRGEDRSGGEIP